MNSAPTTDGKSPAMAEKVSSYVADEWYTASDDGVEVLDASTGQPVAQVSSTGLDVERMVRHAKDVGGPALRELTFHQRAVILKGLVKHLSANTDLFFAESAKAGATLNDARVDVLGGIGVLAVYASKAFKELPDGTVYVAEGSPEKLGKGEKYVGQDIYTSRHGVAVFLNAFNFPVWGMLEKFAPTLLAGLPMIVKPATPTSYITAVVFRSIIESGLLPAGSLQLIAGAVGDLFEHLDGQDSVAFTGSADTAALLRSHPQLAANGVRLNVEADSVNVSILGPDAQPGTEEFGLYVKGVQREMTDKTGQKCTAIRRCLVPEELVQPMLDALRTRLDRIVVGDPRTGETSMGPLVSQHQRDEVMAAVDVLRKAADVVIGGPESLRLGSGDGDKGAFFPPTVLLARDPWAPELHHIEAFGPVVTVIPYRDAREAIDLTALGGGGLVASVVSHDPDFVRGVVLGLAPYHGRILVLDRDDAAEATPHGGALPHLVHGGPGRAGGGEELGGIRAVLNQMQITSVAGSPSALVSITGRWNSFAPQITTDVHPFRRYFEELQLGETLITGTRTLSLDDIETFAAMTGDTFYAHMDEEAATASPLFGGRVIHGYFVISAAAGLFVDPAPGPVLANFGLENLRFIRPVYPGDTIRVRLTCKDKSPKGNEYGEVRWDVGVTNQDEILVAAYDILTINAFAPPKANH